MIRPALFPIACWRINDIRFDFDSSFVRPEITEEIAQLAQLREEHKESAATTPSKSASIYPRLSLFGHADPVGADPYNKTLSGRRATAIYALLVRDVNLWEYLYSHPFGGDDWHKTCVDVMTGALPLLGAQGNQLSADLRSSQTARLTLFAQYMDFISFGLRLDKQSDFLAGSDPEGKGDYQGCGEFNPLLLFSDREYQSFEQPENKEKRDAENSPNRRVVGLLFRPLVRVSATHWPCPRANESFEGCRKRFWSDGDYRRSTRLPDSRRRFEKSKDTFACRFYHRLTSSSPCEAAVVHPVFYYGLEMRARLPWSDEAQIRFISEDGSDCRTYKVSDGAISGTYRVFAVPDWRPNTRYRGEIQDGALVLELFGFSYLDKNRKVDGELGMLSSENGNPKPALSRKSPSKPNGPFFTSLPYDPGVENAAPTAVVESLD